jgi:hypothetical protein
MGWLPPTATVDRAGQATIDIMTSSAPGVPPPGVAALVRIDAGFDAWWISYRTPDPATLDAALPPGVCWLTYRRTPSPRLPLSPFP